MMAALYYAFSCIVLCHVLNEWVSLLPPRYCTVLPAHCVAVVTSSDDTHSFGELGLTSSSSMYGRNAAQNLHLPTSTAVVVLVAMLLFALLAVSLVVLSIEPLNNRCQLLMRLALPDCSV